MPIRISIVEDVRRTRDNLVAMLSKHPNMQVLGAYGTGEAAVEGIPREAPDVALIDINLPGMSGIDCVAQLKALLPKLEVLMVTTYEERDLIFNSLRAGATGYVLKSTGMAELVQAIEQVHAGGAPMSMQIARKVVAHFGAAPTSDSDMEKLTKREYEVLTLLARGDLDKEIADELHINVSTVRTHLKHIYEKLHVQSRTQAAVRYVKRD